MEPHAEYTVETPANEVLEIDLGDGNIILAEVTASPGASAAVERRRDAAAPAGAVRTALDQADATIAATVRWIHGQMVTLGAAAPRTMSVEMSVKLVADTNGLVKLVLGRLGAEATLSIKMEWDLPTAPRPSARPLGPRAPVG